MTLRDRLESIEKDEAQVPVTAQQASAADIRSYQELKSRIHQKLLDRVDLAVMESMSPDRLQEELKTLVERLLSEETLAINEAERRRLVRDIQHEVLGLGPIEPLLADPTISDILANTYRQVYVERAGKLDRDAIRDAIAATDMTTVIGPVTFRADGTGVVLNPVVQWLNGKQECVWPVEHTTAEFVYPAPSFDER